MPLGFGQGKRTMQWATHFEVGDRLPTVKEIHDYLALVTPDWGPRNSYSTIMIPKGTDVTMISGKAKFQISDTTKEKFAGGGYQIRLRDFDMNWIIETKDLLK